MIPDRLLGVVLTGLGGDLLRSVLIADAQQYRATWIMGLTANLFVPQLLLRPNDGPLPLSHIVLRFGLSILFIGSFVEPAYIVSTPILLLAGIAVLLEATGRHMTRPRIRCLVLALLAAIAGLTIVFLIWYMGLITVAQDRFWQTVRGLGLGTITLAMLAAAAGKPQRSVIRWSLIACTVGIVIAAGWSWDQRSRWTRLVERGSYMPHSLSSGLLPSTASVYWEGDVRMPWFVLRRPSFFSCTQGSGALFFRGTAVEYEKRYRLLAPLETEDFGSEDACPLPPASEQRKFSHSSLDLICNNADGLGALVLMHPAFGIPDEAWHAPASLETLTVRGGGLHVNRTDEFYIYLCPRSDSTSLPAE